MSYCDTELYQQTFVCDCCYPKVSLFCEYSLIGYAVCFFVLLFTYLRLYWLQRKDLHLSQSESFYLKWITVAFLCAMVARMAYLSEGVQYRNGSAVTYLEQ